MGENVCMKTDRLQALYENVYDMFLEWKMRVKGFHLQVSMENTLGIASWGQITEKTTVKISVS